MNRAQFEQKLDEFEAEHIKECFSDTTCCLGEDQVRDFIWEELLGRTLCQRVACKQCGEMFVQSRADQKFHTPKCKNLYFQAQRREREKGIRDYET